MIIRYAQIFLVLLAFALMVASSYLFLSETERKHLKRNAENAILHTEANIKVDMQELETLLGVAAETISAMIIRGDGIDSVNNYILLINNYMEASRAKRPHGATGIFGVFNVFDGKMLMGFEIWTPPRDYYLTSRPWYTGAVLAAGEITITEPYLNVYSNKKTITLSRQISNARGSALGIVALNIELDRIQQYVINTQFVEGGYGFLLSENLSIIAHPEPDMVGIQISDVKSGIAALTPELRRKDKISEATTYNYQDMQTIIFMERLQNGWYMGVVTPKKDYFQSTINMAVMLSVLGIIFAIILIGMLLRVSKAMIAQMRKAEIAKESSKAKSDFLAKMSHEIRTPMNAILGITEIQLQDSMLAQPVKEAMERIYSSGNLLIGIINDILDLSKIEAGKLEILPAQYVIASLIHDTVQLNIMRYESKPIEFMLDVNEDVPMLLFGDELRIKQILNNLLSNAFKYTERGMVNLNISCEPENAEGNVTVIFSISDTGQGMTAEQVQKLGTEYARFNMQANRTTEGTGLGMNITMSLISMMKGTLSIESTPGMGTTFVVRLPQMTAGCDTIGRELADNLMKLNVNSTSKIRTVQIKRDYMPYGRVLVVDDVETNIYVAKGLLAPYGLAVDTAMSGFEAIEKVREGSSYDIVFMDHMMPKMDGIEATKIIRNTGYAKPIVALTANAITGQAEIFLTNGFDEFISKPIDIRQLNAVLNKLIRDRYPIEVVEEARRQKNLNIPDNGNGADADAVDHRLAEFFIRDAKKAVSVMEALYENKCRRSGDMPMLIINTHAMKSALANIGQIDLSGDAAKLEQAARDGNTEFILPQLPAFMEALHKVISQLEESESQSAQDTVLQEQDIVYLKEKLSDIRAACTAYEKKAAKDVLSQIREKTWPSEIKEQLTVISEFLLHSDFDEAASFIEEYMKKI